MKQLKDSGKQLYISVGAAANPETWLYFGTKTVAEQQLAAKAFVKFLGDYHFDGVDIDFETFDGYDSRCKIPNDSTGKYYCDVGLTNFVSAISNENTDVKFSMAPYGTDLNAQDPYSVQWQYCQFIDAGVDPSNVVINRQYYSGGYIGLTTEEFIAAVQEYLKAFTCQGGTTHTVTAEQLNPLLGIPPAAQCGVNNCTIPNNSSGPTPACAQYGKTLVQKFSSISGIGLYDLDDVSDIKSYASNMQQALLNSSISTAGTNHTCMVSKNVCTDTGYANDAAAQAACPAVCEGGSATFNGNWSNQKLAVSAAGCTAGVSVCGSSIGDICADTRFKSNDAAQAACPSIVGATQIFNGQWSSEASIVAAAGCSADVSVCSCE
jgi:hypothetical protein